MKELLEVLLKLPELDFTDSEYNSATDENEKLSTYKKELMSVYSELSSTTMNISARFTFVLARCDMELSTDIILPMIIKLLPDTKTELENILKKVKPLAYYENPNQQFFTSIYNAALYKANASNMSKEERANEEKILKDCQSIINNYNITADNQLSKIDINTAVEKNITDPKIKPIIVKRIQEEQDLMRLVKTYNDPNTQNLFQILKTANEIEKQLENKIIDRVKSDYKDIYEQISTNSKQQNTSLFAELMKLKPDKINDNTKISLLFNKLSIARELQTKCLHATFNECSHYYENNRLILIRDADPKLLQLLKNIAKFFGYTGSQLEKHDHRILGLFGVKKDAAKAAPITPSPNPTKKN